MSIVNTYKCEECPKIRGEKNHWFLGHFRPPSKEIDFNGPNRGEILIIPWDNDRAMLEMFKHYCSMTCLFLAIARWGEALIFPADLPLLVVDQKFVESHPLVPEE